MINVNKGENGKTLMFLRSINDSHSAYCEVVFDQDFFDTVKVRSTVNENPDDSDDEYAEDKPLPLAATLPVAAVVKLLRGVVGAGAAKSSGGGVDGAGGAGGGGAGSGKKIRALRISLEEGVDDDGRSSGGRGKDDRLVGQRSSARTSFVNFTFEGTQGERRRHRFLFEEQETMSAIFNTSEASYIRSQPTLVSMLLNNLTSSEASFIVSSETLRVCSYNDEEQVLIQDGKDEEKAKISTEVSVSMSDVDEFHFAIPYADNEEEQQQISQTYQDLEIELVFGTKEMKALLTFCSYETDVMTLYFVDNGAPVLATTKNPKFSAELFLSTIQTDDDAPARIEQRQQLAEEMRERNSSGHDAYHGKQSRSYGDDNQVVHSNYGGSSQHRHFRESNSADDEIVQDSQESLASTQVTSLSDNRPTQDTDASQVFDDSSPYNKQKNIKSRHRQQRDDRQQLHDQDYQEREDGADSQQFPENFRESQEDEDEDGGLAALSKGDLGVDRRSIKNVGSIGSTGTAMDEDEDEEEDEVGSDGRAGRFRGRQAEIGRGDSGKDRRGPTSNQKHHSRSFLDDNNDKGGNSKSYRRDYVSLESDQPSQASSTATARDDDDDDNGVEQDIAGASRSKKTSTNTNAGERSCESSQSDNDSDFEEAQEDSLAHGIASYTRRKRKPDVPLLYESNDEDEEVDNQKQRARTSTGVGDGVTGRENREMDREKRPRQQGGDDASIQQQQQLRRTPRRRGRSSNSFEASEEHQPREDENLLDDRPHHRLSVSSESSLSFVEETPQKPWPVHQDTPSSRGSNASSNATSTSRGSNGGSAQKRSVEAENTSPTPERRRSGRGSTRKEASTSARKKSATASGNSTGRRGKRRTSN